MAFNPMTVNTPPEAAPHIYAEDDAAVFQSIFGVDGILSVGSRFKTEIKTNNLVRLNDGVLCVGGHLGRIKYADYENCVIENGETGYNRNDLIIGSFSNNGEHTIDEMKIEVLKGKATTGIAEDPVVTQGDLYKGEQLRQVPIARVKLEGLNIVGVDMLLPVIPKIPTINKYLSESCIGFPDYTKRLAEYSNKGFTAPENCWARVTSTSGWTNTTLSVNGNGVIIQQIMNTDSYPIKSTVLIPLKKGDVVTMSSQTKVNGITVLLYPMRK